jgi:predicted dehydrogenase
VKIGIIGCGGKGWADRENVAGEDIVALCDVDENALQRAAKLHPGARLFRDYRRMLDEVAELDAVTVSIPDHQHAPAALRAMARGLHVYVQKPLTLTVCEARLMAEAARRHGVATQMGNQGASGDAVRELCELVAADAIGPVREVHAWTDRPIWPQGKDRPAGADPVPAHLDWDLWLGPAPLRPFVRRYPDVDRDVYHPFCWRGWHDFGTGALGDIGCHTLHAPVLALKLGPPESVEVVDASEAKPESFPSWSVIRWDFPARGPRPPVKLFWYDGGKKPPLPPEMEGGEWAEIGVLLVGDRGKIYRNRLIPEARMKDLQLPPPTLPRIPNENHYQDWLSACRGGPPGCSNFDIAGPLTETVLLGNIALRLRRKITWDPRRLRVPGLPEADALIRGSHRPGWDVPVG